MISKVYWRVGLAALISIYAIACSDQGSSNSSNDSDRSNETRTIETDNGTVTIRRDPNNEDARIVSIGSPSEEGTPVEEEATFVTDIVDCRDSNDSSFLLRGTGVDACD